MSPEGSTAALAGTVPPGHRGRRQRPARRPGHRRAAAVRGDVWRAERNIDPDLLDDLPLLGDILASAPARLQAGPYQAFSLELLYNNDMHQGTIWATITDATPRALAAIIVGSEDFTAAAAPPVSDLAQHPGACWILRDHGLARPLGRD